MMGGAVSGERAIKVSNAPVHGWSRSFGPIARAAQLVNGQPLKIRGIS